MFYNNKEDDNINSFVQDLLNILQVEYNKLDILKRIEIDYLIKREDNFLSESLDAEYNKGHAKGYIEGHDDGYDEAMSE